MKEIKRFTASGLKIFFDTFVITIERLFQGP